MALPFFIGTCGSIHSCVMFCHISDLQDNIIIPSVSKISFWKHNKASNKLRSISMSVMYAYGEMTTKYNMHCHSMLPLSSLLPWYVQSHVISVGLAFTISGRLISSCSTACTSLGWLGLNSGGTRQREFVRNSNM